MSTGAICCRYGEIGGWCHFLYFVFERTERTFGRPGITKFLKSFMAFRTPSYSDLL
jgi:hypothetical protein